jgi:hypothetical protein
VFQNGVDLFAGNARKPSKKIIDASTAFKVLKERFYGHSGPSKDPSTADFARITLDGGTI